MTESLTPLTHGQWRVIDGKLVDESALPAAAAEAATPKVVVATPDVAPNAPQKYTPSMRVKAPKKHE